MLGAHTADAVQFGHLNSKVAENNFEGMELMQEKQPETWDSISASGDRRD